MAHSQRVEDVRLDVVRVRFPAGPFEISPNVVVALLYRTPNRADGQLDRSQHPRLASVAGAVVEIRERELPGNVAGR